MDVWRYSDWYGRRTVPDIMNSYAMIWRWRDWIVRSLNDDKGYDRMVIEMLAADEVSPEAEGDLVATGFIVRNWFKWNYESWKKDLVEHTGKAFLGLTFNCAHCHDHKYDPITQEDYFRFRAFFEPLELRHDRVPGEADPGPFKKYVYGQAYGPITSGMVRVFDEKLDAETFLYRGGDSRNRVDGKPPLTPAAPSVLGGDALKIEPIDLPPTAWYPGLKPWVQQEEIAKAAAAVSNAEGVLTAARQRLTTAEAPAEGDAAEAEIEDARLARRTAEAALLHVRAQLLAVEARVNADKAKYLSADGTSAPAAEALTRSASMAERLAAHLGAQVQVAHAEQTLAAARRAPQTDETAAALAAAEQGVVTARGAVDAAQAALAADSDQYTPFSPTYPVKTTGRRAALARWIASRDNPLAARVAVNHIWLRHFGSGLVPTPDNFGRNGKPPTHPALLDWLAVELMENNWSMKRLHRLIVTSNTYRTHSYTSEAEALFHANAAIDAENKLLWRFNTLRMEAEVVRDAVLHVAGELDLNLGGADIDHAQGMTVPRRSLYFTHHGEEKMVMMDLFDGASPTECYRRTSTVIPQQALALANSELTLNNAKALAQKLWQAIEQETTDPAAQEPGFIVAAFEQVLSRKPSDAEQAACAAFLARQTAAIQAATTEAAAGADQADARAQARRSLIHSLLNHNDFVTIR